MVAFNRAAYSSLMTILYRILMKKGGPAARRNKVARLLRGVFGVECLRGGATVVGSPLNSLIEDQREKREALGIRSAQLSPCISQWGLNPPQVAQIEVGDDAFERTGPESDSGPRVAAGEQVRVPKFDLGTVLGVDGDQVTIVFPDASGRTLLANFVKPA